MAVFDLSQLPSDQKTVNRLREGLESPNEARRGASALALALLARERLRLSPELHGYLITRTTPEHRIYETRLPLRGYYLCGLLLLGRSDVLPRIRSLVLAGDIPPTTVILAMLLAGCREGLDLPLFDPTAMGAEFDLRAFLCDRRFGTVLASLFPAAPRVDWRLDPEFQEWQIRRLRDWWRVYRWEYTK